MRKSYKMLSKIALASLTLSGCGSIKIKDFLVYGDKGKFGATGVHTLCDTERCPPVLLKKAQWDELRIGMVCTDANNFADMQANIDRFCAKNPNVCEYEEVVKAKAALSRIVRAAKRK